MLLVLLLLHVTSHKVVLGGIADARGRVSGSLALLHHVGDLMTVPESVGAEHGSHNGIVLGSFAGARGDGSARLIVHRVRLALKGSGAWSVDSVWHCIEY